MRHDRCSRPRSLHARLAATSSFGIVTLGGAVSDNLTPWIGFEGEVTGTLGISQNLQFGAINGSLKTPNMVGYTGDHVVFLAPGSSVMPYAAGGVRWYANHRWGRGADYRFVGIQQKDDGAPFFGRDTRYGHRVYGAVIVNAWQ